MPQGLSDRSLITQIIVICSINILPTFIAIAGNAICITALVKTPSLQTTSNIWVGAMCIIDVIVGLFIQPVYYAALISLITGTGKGIKDRWVDSKYSIILLTNESLVLAYFVTIDRYIAIFHPLWHARVVTRKRYLFVAIVGFLLSIPTITMDVFAPMAARYYVAALVLLIVSQIIGFSSRIYIKVLRQKGQTGSAAQDRAEMQRRRLENKRAYTIATLIATMYILYGPLSVVITTSDNICTMPDEKIVAIAWGIFFVLLHSAVKPIVYYFRMNGIRNAIKDMFQRKENISVENPPNDVETLKGISLQ